MAVGTNFRLITHLLAKPGISLWVHQRGFGVTSRSLGPVPPVVHQRAARVHQLDQRCADASLLIGNQAFVRSPGCAARGSTILSARQPLSTYTPALARSLTDDATLTASSAVVMRIILVIGNGWLIAGVSRAFMVSSQLENLAVGRRGAGPRQAFRFSNAGVFAAWRSARAAAFVSRWPGIRQ
jgi:hypothetical protein